MSNYVKLTNNLELLKLEKNKTKFRSIYRFNK